MKLQRPTLFFEHENLDQGIIRNLKLMLWATAFQSISGNILGGVVYTGYWRKLGASDFTYGLIVGCPSIFVLLQFVASLILEKTRARRKLFLVVTFFDRFRWIPFALIPYIIPMEQQQARLIASMAIVFIAACIGSLGSVSAASITNAVLPIKIRGRYFTTENMISSWIGFFCAAAIGWVLDSMAGLTGYSLLFIVAAVTGLIYFFFWLRVDIPPMTETETVHRCTIPLMLKEVLKDKNYVKFTTFAAIRSFGLNMAIPYFVVYLLSDYMQMTNTQLVWFWYNTAFVTRVLFLMPWGRALDRYGSKPVLKLGGFFTSIMPMMWLFIGKGMIGWVSVAACCSGVSLVACEYACTNLFYSQAKGKNKSAYYAYYNIVVTLVGAALGTAVGGWLLDYVFIHFEGFNLSIGGWRLNRYNYFLAFNSLVRFFPFVFLLPRFNEESAISFSFMIRDIFARLRAKLRGT